MRDLAAHYEAWADRLEGSDAAPPIAVPSKLSA
jgi:hypothetical protein